MATDNPHPDDEEDALHHLAGQPHDALAGWIVAILLLLAAVLAIGLDRDAEIPANSPPKSMSATADVLMDDRAFAPGVIVVRPNERVIMRNVGKDLQALTLVGREDILQDAFIEPGASFTFKIPPTLAPGAYRLLCTTHDKMSAMLVVRAGMDTRPTERPPGASPRGGRLPARSNGPGASIGHPVRPESPTQNERHGLEGS